MTSRSDEMARRVADVELRLAEIDDRFVEINRWLLEAFSSAAHTVPASVSTTRQVAHMLDTVRESTASRSANKAQTNSSGNSQGDEPRSLAAWVNWVTTAFDLSERWPSCWYRHEGLVFEMRSLRHWHVALATALASDPTASTKWSEAVHRVAKDSARHVAQHCLSTHRDAPTLDPVPEGAALPMEISYLRDKQDGDAG